MFVKTFEKTFEFENLYFNLANYALKRDNNRHEDILTRAELTTSVNRIAGSNIFILGVIFKEINFEYVALAVDKFSNLFQKRVFKTLLIFVEKSPALLSRVRN